MSLNGIHSTKPLENGDALRHELLVGLIDYLPDFVYVKDTQGRYLLDNAAHRTFIGVKTMEEILGKTVFDFFPKEMAERYHRDDQEILLKGVSLLNREEPIVGPKGEHRWVSTTKVPLRNRDGTIIGLVAIGRDITDRKRSEEALEEKHRLLRTLIDNLPDYIFVKDTQGRFLLTNQAHAEVLGAATPEDVSGRTDTDFFPPEMARHFQETEKRVIETGKPLLGHEEPYTDREGKQRWVSTSKVPLHDRHGRVIGLVGLSRDITDRKWAEEQLTRYASTLRERNLQMQDDLNMAAEIQIACLPQHFPSFPRHASEQDSALRFYRCYHPSGTVGGDFFDVVPLSDWRAGVFICDVMGHGIRSALVTAMVRALIEELAQSSDDPAQMLFEMNRGLITILRQLRTPMFASAFYMVVDAQNGVARYASAGHPHPLHLHRRTGQVTPLRFTQTSPGPALGVFEEAQFFSNECVIEPGDGLLLYTDGLFEAEGPGGDEFGEERLLTAVQKRLVLPPGQLLDGVLAEVKAFSGTNGFADDVCLLAVEVAHLKPGDGS